MAIRPRKKAHHKKKQAVCKRCGGLLSTKKMRCKKCSEPNTSR